MVVRGPSGIGKSRLLGWMLAEAGDRGMRTALARAPTSVPASLGTLASEILAALDVGEVPGSIGRGNEAAVLALARALDEAVGAGSALVAVDDLQAVEPRACAMLIDAMRLASASIGFVGAWRTGDDDREVPAGSGGYAVEVVDVEPLSIEDARALAADVLGQPVVPSLAEQLHRATGGVPLLMLERLREWRTADALTAVGGLLTVDDGADGPPREPLRAALVRATDEELAILRPLALLERDASFEQTAALSGLSGERLSALLSMLERAGWIAASHDGRGLAYRLSHETRRAIVIEQLDATMDASLRDRILGALGATLPVEERAHHAMRALTPPDDLPDLLRGAAEEAEREGSVTRAASYRRRLAEISDDVRSILEHADVLTKIDPAAALRRYEEAAASASDEETRARADAGRGQMLMLLDQSEEGLAAMQRAVDLVEDDVRPALQLKLAGMLISLGRSTEAKDMLRALADAGSAKAFGMLAAEPYARGDLQEACRLIDEGLDHAADRTERLFLWSNLAWGEVLLGEWEQAARVLSRAIAEAEEAESFLRLWRLQACAVTLEAWRGRADVAIDTATGALRTARTLATPAVRADLTNAMALALLELGQPVEALRATDDDAGMPIVAVTRCEAALAIGDAALAASALEIAARVEPWRAVTIDRLRARIALADGDPARAAELLEPHDAAPSILRFEQARALQVLAEARWKTGRRREALDAVRRAAETYADLGATGWHERASAWLAERAGSRRRREPGEMTPREREVMELAVEGFTNAQIAERLVLSPGTVKKHMENILARTGARRRSELHRFLQPRP